MLVIVGVDPGTTSGVAVLRFSGPSLANLSWRDLNVTVWQGADPLSYIRAALAGRQNGERWQLAVERYVISHRSGHSQYVSGGEAARATVINLVTMGREMDIPVYIRAASLVKPWATDRRLHVLGLKLCTQGQPHSRDAARHAVFTACQDFGLPDPLREDGFAR